MLHPSEFSDDSELTFPFSVINAVGFDALYVQFCTSNMPIFRPS